MRGNREVRFSHLFADTLHQARDVAQRVRVVAVDRGGAVMSKFTFDEAIERINDQRSVDAKDVRADALRRTVWIAEWHLPGCLSESWAVCLTKADAIRCALEWADCGDGAPRGMATALRRYGRFDSHSDMFGTCVNTIERTTLGGIL